MNALVAFRANVSGTLSVTKADRQAARETISANAKASAVAPGSTDKAVDTGEPVAGAAGDQLDRDAFLQLLVLEMQNQNPLEPVDNAEMVAQLAQFSSLEQMQQLNDRFEGVVTGLEYLTGNIDQLNFINAQSMLGKYVEGVGMDGGAVTGTVDAVHLEGSIVVLTVDGEVLPMTNVLSVADEAPVAESDHG